MRLLLPLMTGYGAMTLLSANLPSQGTYLGQFGWLAISLFVITLAVGGGVALAHPDGSAVHLLVKTYKGKYL